MQPSTTVPMLLAVAVFATACSSNTPPTQDSLTSPSATVQSASFSATAPTAIAQAVNHPSCPSVAPFTVPLGLIVRANGRFNVFLTQIRVQFTDPFRMTMPQITLPAPMLTTQFGTALVEARSARTFLLTVPVGCGTGRSGTVMIAVDTMDENGGRASGQVTVSVH